MKGYLYVIVLFISTNILAQNTVGLLSYNPAKAYEGYNLIYPHNQSSVYLLNNCGEIVHKWTDEENFRPGNMAYILENGDLFKCKRLSTSAVNDRIWAGGAGETVELRNWENDLLASFTLNNEQFRLHHDIAPLPNGNVLMIAWEIKTGIEALEAGRDTSELSQGEVWSERILEWNPSSNEIVWAWSVWGHLIQDFDETKSNFGTVAEHPELVDINYDEHNGNPDWLHINAIDYNPVLDQVVLSVPHFNELWIIDHSTTTEEASTHGGGDSGKGGDLLYRWGNLMAYNQGIIEDKKLFFQHDVHWANPIAAKGDKLFGRISLFNNRVAIDRSTGNIINTNFNTTTKLYELIDNVFSPIDFEQVYEHPKSPDELRAASASVSSFQVLPNDNVLFCSGRRGYSYEINPENKVIWEYFTPFKNGSPVEQGGETIELGNNLTFRLNRYPIDFPAFIGRDLTSKGFIELNPNKDFCGTLSVNTQELVETTSIEVYPNPVNQVLTIEKGINFKEDLILFDNLGRTIFYLEGTSEMNHIDVSNLRSGVYFLGTKHKLVEKIIIN